MADSSENPLDLLNAAVTAKVAISVVNVDRGGDAISAQFVALAKPTDPGLIWARPAVKYVDTAKTWAAMRANVSVRFSVDRINAGAEAVIVKLIRDYWLTDTLPISALLLQEPTKVWVEQREHRRYQLRNDGGGIRAILSRSSTADGAKVIGPESRATLWDIGLGGAGFILPVSRALAQTAPNQPFEVTLDFAGKRAVLPGTCAYAHPKGNLLHIGIQFTPAIAAPDASALLAQVVTELEKRSAQWDRRSA